MVVRENKRHVLTIMVFPINADRVWFQPIWLKTERRVQGFGCSVGQVNSQIDASNGVIACMFKRPTDDLPAQPTLTKAWFYEASPEQRLMQ